MEPGGLADSLVVAVGRVQRRAERQARFEQAFGTKSGIALDLVEVLEFAWHDCYHDMTPPDQVLDDIVVCARGSVEELITAARLAIADWRDLRVRADGLRRGTGARRCQ